MGALAPLFHNLLSHTSIFRVLRPHPAAPPRCKTQAESESEPFVASCSCRLPHHGLPIDVCSTNVSCPVALVSRRWVPDGARVDQHHCVDCALQSRRLALLG